MNARTTFLRWICVICLSAIFAACEVAIDVNTAEFDHDIESDNSPWTHEDFEDQRMQEIYRARAVALEILDGDEPEKWPETEYFKMPERSTGSVRAEQAAYFRGIIADNPQVRWTFLFMHKPVWRNESATEFQSIEAALSDRPYTVINGHLHSYSLTERNGRDYIHLATTSGSQNAADDMAFDHVTLVTVAEGEPSIVNLRMDGILDKSGHIPLDGDDLCYQASACAE